MSHFKDFSSELRNILSPEDIFFNEPMKKHITFRVGGPADVLVTPTEYEQVSEIIKLCRKYQIPHYIVGNGSNLLVKDGGIRGLVIKLKKLKKVRAEGERVIAQSGVTLLDACKAALAAGLTGLEFSCGIPGSVGGALAMNAGAYLGEISNVVESAVVIDTYGELKTIHKEEMELSYRMSGILKYSYTVLEVTFKLEKGEYEKIKNRMDDLTVRRKERQPLEYPSAGSTFKRPEGHYAAKLIEDSGLKGVSVGEAVVSPKHSGFIINRGNASAKDILNLVEVVQKEVKDKFNVELHMEVRILGED